MNNTYQLKGILIQKAIPTESFLKYLQLFNLILRAITQKISSKVYSCFWKKNEKMIPSKFTTHSIKISCTVDISLNSSLLYKSFVNSNLLLARFLLFLTHNVGYFV